MDNETEVIREKMEDARTDLTDKLELLEKQVRDTVQGATSAVADSVQSATSTVTDTIQSVRDVVDSVKDSVQGTVDSVKDSVQGTVDSVKETMADTVEGVRQTFDLHRQVDNHPYLMVGGAVVVGFVAGRLLNVAPAARAMGRAAESFGPSVSRFAQSAASNLGTAASAVGSTAASVGGAAVTTGGWMGALESMFGPEIDKVKELAIGTLLGVVRDMAVKAAPETMVPQVREIMDGLTTKLGGKPIEGPVFETHSSDGNEIHHDAPSRRF
jgi:phage-related protein